ncbi:MAG: phage portal protein [Oscillospiraceae bacterium]|jgi:HK97 family phage portal protein|nr:phage portal protein [Oscillospiraceae bacterium]
MGIFSRKKPAAQDALSTSRGSIFWSGPATSGAFVSETTALQTAAVYSCVRVISESIASLPLHVYRYENDGTRLVPEHHLFNVLHNAPNPEMTSFVFRETLMSHLLLYGNAYAQIIRDGGGQVLALYPLLPNKMDVTRGEDGKIRYTYWRDMDESRPREKSGGIMFRRDEVLHIPGLSFDGLVGYSPIYLAKNAVGMALATEEYGAAFFANGANPGGVLEHTQAVKNPETLRNLWDTLYRGAKNTGKIAVLEDGLKFHSVSIPPEQAQFLETRKFQLNEIARIFRVPPHMIGDLEKSSFSNIEQQSLEFVKYTLGPWVTRWEQAMQQALVLPSEQSRIAVKFNLDGLLRGDYETRMKGYAIGVQNGFMSINDCRRLENMNPVAAADGGDEYMVNGNMISVRTVHQKAERGLVDE